MSNWARKTSRLKHRLIVGLVIVLLLASEPALTHSFASLDQEQFTLRLIKKITRTKGEVQAIVLSDDSRFLVPATWENKTEIWDVESGRLIATVDGRVLRPFDYSDFKLLDAFSPDGRTLVTTVGKELKLWDAATGKFKLSLKGHTKDIRSQAFSPDGSTIATGAPDGTVKLWDAETGALKFTLDAFEVKNYPRWRIVSRRISGLLAELHVEFSPDGTKLLTVPAGQPTKIWNVKTGKREAVLTDQDFSGKFSPTGRFLIAMKEDSRATDLWEMATGQLKATFTVGPVAFSSDEKWLGLVGHNGKNGLFNLKTMEVEHKVPLEVNNFVTWTSFSPDNQIFVQASGLSDHRAALVEVSSGKIIAQLPIVAKKGFDLVSDFLKYWEKLSFHPSSQVLMGANQDLVRFWDPKSGKQLAVLNEARDPSSFGKNGKLLVTTDKDKKSLSLWHVVIR
jgi:WD40 repeat protein